MTGPTDPSRGARRRRIFLDISPLRLDHDFRRLWSGQVVSQIGNQITRLALPYQIYAQTGSTLAIAALALFQLVPLIAFSLGAGSIVDVVDRRKLLIRTQLGLMACSGLLLVLSFQASVPLVVLFAIAFTSAAIGTLDQPARWSSTARLVPASRLPAAISLNQLNVTTAAVVGPTVAGLIIASAGLSVAYLVDFLTFLAALVALRGMAPLPPIASATRPGLAAIREGLRFAFGRRVILSTYVIDLNAMIFGLPVSLFPALALDVFHAGPQGLGLLAAAPAVGAMLAALFSGWVARVRRVGRAVIVSVAIWGIAITLFGLAQFSFPLALLCLAVAGAADITSAVFRSTIIQLAAPDQLRGRISSINTLVVAGGPRVGDIEAAAVASVIGAQASVVSGGILVLLGLVGVVRLFPELVHHVHPLRSDPEPPTEPLTGE